MSGMLLDIKVSSNLHKSTAYNNAIGVSLFREPRLLSPILRTYILTIAYTNL